MTAQGLNRGGGLIRGGRKFGTSPGIFARLLAPGFHKLLDRIDAGLETGSILGHLPNGETRLLGGRAAGFDAVVQLNDWRGLIRLATAGSVGWFQAWEAGEWETPDLVTVFAVFNANAASLGDAGRAKGFWRAGMRFAHWLNRNTHAGSERNINAHYDLGNDFYGPWLGETMAYSSGLFSDGETRLGAAQTRKIAALAERLEITPNDRVLEIGCGWGTLAAHLADDFGADVTAISLSDEQLAYARDHRVPGKGSVQYLKQDYRDVAGRFDSIASCEMVEALGRAYWPTFMDTIARCLKPGGRAAIQYISFRDDLFEAYASSADFIQAYVFPGGLLIRNSEFRALAEARGLAWSDQTDFGMDYAETLRIWRENFEQAVDAGQLPAGFDQKFIRLWRYYLTYCEGGFRGGGIDVHQVTLVKETTHA
ncbi:cyclopropane-fatty-acyl-phospholipid synthase family protein [Altererythrobacter aquiaggeris]|uniref:cyclopropane-fatty-acyl-phospholipid synthase family protein n=1 Tax=Aestuarierythrobacter aquiaggeris TaxID=1898396 RepID=UPI00301A61D9